LTEQKIKETISELKEWLEKPLSKESYTVYGIDKVEAKLKETRIPKSIINGFDSLNNWYSNNFVYDMLTQGTSKHTVELCANGYHILTLFDILVDKYSNPTGLLFDKVAYWLANCVIVKWYDKSKILIDITNKGLTTNFLKGGLDFKLSSWFILHVLCKGFGKFIDYRKYNYPVNMGIYQKSLDNWNTNDLQLLNNIVSEMCDFHLENATYGDGENTADIQFGHSEWFVHAFEILSWLSIREMNGIKNPDKFSHPLMGLALNQLPEKKLPFPDNELFERVMQKLIV
jgi:hypothetical protein